MTEQESISQEPDALNVRAILVVAVVAGAIFAGAVVVAWGLLEAWRPPVRPDETTAYRVPRELGIVEQTLVREAPSAFEVREAQRRELERWRWLDRDDGRLQMPIEDAMDAVEAGARP